MGNFFTNPVRHPEDVGVGHIRRRFQFNTAMSGVSPGIPIGALEKGAIPLRVTAAVITAFNAGTTNTLTLGNIANPGAGQGAVVDSFGTNASIAPGAAGVKAAAGVALGQELPADTVLYALFTQTGTPATAGDIEIVVEFVNPRNWSDNFGGQAS